MLHEIKNRYCNITRDIVMKFISFCKPCKEKQNLQTKGFVSKPILSKEFNSRGQVDLIDMQSQSYNDYKFIMTYQDHLTKFTILNALRTKTAEEVAINLLNIFTVFRAPAILQFNNGREFYNSIINELIKMWKGMKIVHGKPRHSQS